MSSDPDDYIASNYLADKSEEEATYHANTETTESLVAAIETDRVESYLPVADSEKFPQEPNPAFAERNQTVASIKPRAIAL